jgi:hypothetical protein
MGEEPAARGSHRVMPEIHSPVKSLITPRMQDGVRGTSSGCGDGFAKQVAGNVEKREAPTFFRHRIEIRLDENLYGLLAGINLDTNGRVTEIDLMSSSVRSANNGVGHCRTRFRGSAAISGHRRPVSPQADILVIMAWNGSRRLDQGGHSKRPTTT